MKYIVPEYYKNFKCKCGKCRHSCCEGWPIRISMKEYYFLLGIKCSAKLRIKLDCALKVCHEPSNDYYAQISSDWHGICMLHREDGLCALQAENTEGSLPEVCRLYPRNSKQLIDISICSCSNSCEAVIELLMDLKEPLRFEEKELSIVPAFIYHLPSKKYEICNKSISFIQDRNLPLPERLIDLGNFLYGANIYNERPNNMSHALQLLILLNKYYERSNSISDYCKAAQLYYGIDGVDNLTTADLNIVAEKYLIASDHLEAILPNWQLLFEQLLVNHMFYNNFPHTDNQENVNDAFLSLLSMYSFLRFNLLGFLFDKTNMEHLIDYLAAMFRLIEHSNFKNIAVNLYKNEKFPAQDCALQLLYV